MRPKYLLPIILACTLLALPLFALAATSLVPADHIVGDSTPPAQAAVRDFTVGIAAEGDYQKPIYEFWQAGRDSFFFVTGDPARAAEDGTVISVSYQGVNYPATLLYSARQNFAATPTTSPVTAGVALMEVSPLPVFQNNATYFFDAGDFVDTDDYSVVNRFAGTAAQNSRSFVGLYTDADSGEPLTTFYKLPANETRPNAARGFMARTVFNAPNIHIENIIWDGSGIDMVRQGESSRGEYYWFVSTNATNFVVRDVIMQNIGARTSLPVLENLNSSNHRKNVAINIFSAGSYHTGTSGTQRNFENLTIRNTRTMSAFGIIQFNRTSGNYFYNLNLANPNAGGTGIAHSAAANTYPLKIEHTPIGTATLNVTYPVAAAVTGNEVAAQQRDFVFAGVLTMPQHTNSAIYIQDYRYQNILVPADFSWALARTANGGNNTPSLRVYNHKRPQTAAHGLLQLDTGYWVVEAQDTAPNLQTQLNNIRTIIDINNPAGADPLTAVPLPSIKMIANAAGEVSGFSVPDFVPSHTSATIVALRQTDTPASTVHAAAAHASGVGPADDSAEFVTYSGSRGDIVLPTTAADMVKLFNLDFRTVTAWTIEDATTGDPLADPAVSPGIVRFSSENSGRNLFVKYIDPNGDNNGSVEETETAGSEETTSSVESTRPATPDSDSAAVLGKLGDASRIVTLLALLALAAGSAAFAVAKEETP
ncbi:MAG: hypothetical protein FWF11_04820 [Coriobacteriia bacterium]|nr:hypothetical protein [Coriobacteriia bacterium]